MDILEFEETFSKVNKDFHLTTETCSVVKNEDIEITTTGHDWDAIAIVENKTGYTIDIDFYDLEEETITILPHNHCLLLADAIGRAMLLQFLFNNYIVSYRNEENN